MPAPLTTFTISVHGDEEQLFRAHHARLVPTVQRLAGVRRECAEDAASFAWIQLLRFQPDRGDPLFAWLLKVAIRQARRLDHYEHRAGSLDAIPNWQELLGDSSTDELLDTRATLANLAKLPTQQRRYLTMHLAGYSYTEIAGHHHATFTNVNKNISRARHNMRIHRHHAA